MLGGNCREFNNPRYKKNNMIHKFRKASPVVEAVQYDGSNVLEVIDFTNGSAYKYGGKDDTIIIPAIAGDIQVITGDWIIKDFEGNFYLCKPDTFQKTYESEPNFNSIESPPAGEGKWIEIKEGGEMPDGVYWLCVDGTVMLSKRIAGRWYYMADNLVLGNITHCIKSVIPAPPTNTEGTQPS